MMQAVVLDTETSGFYSNKVGVNHPEQARVVEIGWMVVDFYPTTMHVRERYSSLIKQPDWFVMPSGAFKAHGISTALLQKEGEDLRQVLYNVAESIHGASGRVICHNTVFDMKILDLSLSQLNWPYDYLGIGETFCTMKAATNICRIPKTQYKGFKWPTLSEAYTHVVKKTPGALHRALSDANLCAVLYQHLPEDVKQEWWVQHINGVDMA